MNRLIATLFFILACSTAVAQTNDIDTELGSLSGKIAGLVKDHEKKKVAVLDFTDLQGSPNGELGKYIAEQLTVDLVMEKRDFSVLDRANLRKILAEHKLTASGLVDPDNAKKLGMFAGVDALILGSIIPKDATVSLTVKIITTDTAEIVGAARAQFKSDDTVKQLIAKPAAADTTPFSGDASEPNRKLFGDLQAKVESLVLLPGDNTYGWTRMTMVITNTSDTTTYGVAINPDVYKTFNLANNRGDEFKANEVTGIEKAAGNYGVYQGGVSDIPPRGSIKLVAKSYTMWNGRPGDYRPYHFQTEVVYGAESQGRHPQLEKYNLVLDIK